ncbi:hypothetical protein E2553_00635 [Paraburkholderia dipogonis]|uniref:Uncharacterized protein n=1 Tax=Paraburkholderia dipogonis TaxID=1211383 RepID=A0A4Y8N1T3_9BURK|nr:hypothetical protein [Paraburkholderia dipogonis]TFE43664.1 hypothetical protein E2553_00635 [Paraburkholderia dipogonis]
MSRTDLRPGAIISVIEILMFAGERCTPTEILTIEPHRIDARILAGERRGMLIAARTERRKSHLAARTIEPVTIGPATLFNADALAVLPQLAGLDALLTDPPSSSGGQFRSDRVLDTWKKTFNRIHQANSYRISAEMPATSARAGRARWV